MRYTASVALMLLTAIAFAQFDLPRPRVPRTPDVGDVVRDTLKIRIPDLRNILDEPAAVSTTFEDAVYAVAFLDNLNPTATAPMAQLPDDGNGAFIVALPGVYELRARSFCLHAGTHGPGQGEGYLYAPLKGAKAGAIIKVLDRYVHHPELDQQQVQSLIWGIQAKAKIGSMSPELRSVANTLLTRDEIRSLDGGALGMVPEELFDQAFVDVPPEMRMVLEAEAHLRNRLTQEVWDFDALEEVAVLAGDPDFPDGDIVPRGRWSFEPDGYFVRYFPDGYPETTIQLYSPEVFDIRSDGLGRIISVVDRSGPAIQFRYGAAASPVPGDENVMAHPVQLITLISSDGNSTEFRPAELVALTGIPAGTGRFQGQADALYSASAQLAQQVRDLAGQVSSASPDSQLMGNVMDLAHLCNTFDTFVETTPGANSAAWQMLLKRAWGSELALMLAGVGPQPVQARAPSSPYSGLLMALLPWTESVVMADAGFAAGTIAWNPRPAGRGGGLPVFKPSRGTATPANRGRQRLGVSGAPRELPTYDPRPSRDPDQPPQGGDSKSASSRARDGIKAFQRGKQVIDVVTGPKAAARNAVGFSIPNYLFGKILDFNFDAWGRATEALNTDPPRDDFTEMATPELLALPPLSEDAALSPEHARAMNALMEALAANLSIARAGVVSVDRLGGALAAGNDEWATRQAEALIGYKQQVGQGMIVISERLMDVVSAIQAAGVTDITVTPEAAAAYQQRLRAEGFDAEERQAAHLLGISDEQLQAMLAERIAADPQDLAGSVLDDATELAEALWWLGMSWSQLPSAASISEAVAAP